MSFSPRHIDHLVLAVRDLEAAADFYRRVGFQVGSRNRHPWGTENHLVQFESSFLELITVGDATAIPPHEPGRFSFGAFVRDYLTDHEGFAMFVLDSINAKADAATFRQEGIGAFEPFFFERKGRRPDGKETHVAFTLAFAMDPGLPNASFFRCQQHFPENFWNPDFQIHSNGATRVRKVSLATERPADHADFLSSFTGVDGVADQFGNLSYPLDREGQLVVESTHHVSGLVGFEITVSNLALAEEHVRSAKIRFRKGDGHIVIGAADAFGAAITLAQHKPTPG